MTTVTSKVERAAAAPRPSRPSRRHRRGLLVALAFLAPLLFFYGLYYVYAFIFLAQTSTTQVSLSFTNAIAVGLDNYRLVLTDPIFIHAIVNNLVFSLVLIAASLTIGFLVAMALASGVKANRLLYVIFLLPSVIPLSLFGTVFARMLGSQYGAVNELLSLVGLGGLRQNWLGTPVTAYASIFVLLVFLIGLPIMYYRSDVESINSSLIEAAVIDGAGTWRIYRSILFPLLRNTHKTVIISMLLSSFRAFDLIFFTTQGGPSNATVITGTYIYTKTLAGQTVGYASAASVVLLIIALMLSVAQLIIFRTRSDR